MPAVSVEPVGITYGTALANAQLTGTATFVVNGSLVNVPGTFTYTSAAGTVLNAGSYTEAVTFTATDTTDYQQAPAAVQVFVAKATPIITWPTPSPIAYGTALSSAQLDATASWTIGSTTGPVAGSFTYSPPAGTLLGAGTQTLATTFTPTDTADYNLPPAQTVQVAIYNAPAITSSPASVDVDDGVPVTFTSAASGTALNVQWQMSTDGVAFTNIPGANSPTYALVVDASLNGDVFQAVYTNPVGTATTAAATLTVHVIAPVIVTNPVNQAAGSGESVTFTAAARGFPSPAAQWQSSSDGVTFTNIAGATGTSYTLKAAPAANQEQYRVTFTNAGGSVASKPARLAVSGSVPSVTRAPVSQTANPGQAITFTAQGSGSPAPGVQWQVSVDGGNTFSNIQGATAASLRITAATSANGYQYRAVFSNRWGPAASAAATLTVTGGPSSPPLITTPLVGPASAVSAGQRVTLTAAASDAGTVQWQQSSDGVNFAPIAGANANRYSFAAQVSLDGEEYRAVFINPFGQTPTNAVTLAVNPIIITQPASQTVYSGETVTFISAAAAGNATPAVQWQVSTDGKTFANLTGATLPALTLAASAADAGLRYRAVFMARIGTIVTQAVSASALLAVRFDPAVPAVTLQPVSQTVVAGKSVTFTAAAIANPAPASVQWQVRARGSGTFANIPGANTGTLTIIATAADNGSQYRAVFSNGRSAATTAATLTLGVVPALTLQPADQSARVGAPVTFTAAASAVPSAAVEWQVSVDGGQTYTTIADAARLRLTFIAIAQDDGNFYRAVFTNPVGQATTAAALLTIE
jgi:hypothetical protein